MDTLHEHEHTCTIILPSVHLKMRNVSQNLERKSKHTSCSITFFFLKIVPFMK